MYELPIIKSDLNKTQIKMISQQVIDDLLENGRIIESAETISKMELLIKEIKSNSKWVDYVREQISLHGKEFISPSGTKIELAEVGTKYDFSQCNDEILDELLKQQETIDLAVKERQSFLKSIPAGGMDIITKHGECVKIFAPSKSSTSSFKTTIAK